MYKNEKKIDSVSFAQIARIFRENLNLLMLNEEWSTFKNVVDAYNASLAYQIMPEARTAFDVGLVTALDYLEQANKYTQENASLIIEPLLELGKGLIQSTTWHNKVDEIVGKSVICRIERQVKRCPSDFAAREVLAMALMFGFCQESNVAKAVEQLEQLATQGSEQSAWQLAKWLTASEQLTYATSILIRSSQSDEGKKKLNDFIRKFGENPEVCYRLAQHYLYGIGVEADEAQFEKYYQETKKLGYKTADFLKGFSLAYGMFGHTDTKQAILLLQQCAGDYKSKDKDKKYIPAFALLAQLYLDDASKVDEATRILLYIKDDSALAKYLLIDGIRKEKIKLGLVNNRNLLKQSADEGFHFAQYVHGTIKINSYKKYQSKNQAKEKDNIHDLTNASEIEKLKIEGIEYIEKSQKCLDFYEDNKILLDNTAVDTQVFNYFKNPEVYQGLVTLGQLYLEDKSYDKALSFLQQAVNHHHIKQENKVLAKELIKVIDINKRADNISNYITSFKQYKLPYQQKLINELNQLNDLSILTQGKVIESLKECIDTCINEDKLNYAVTLIAHLVQKDPSEKNMLDNFIKNHKDNDEVNARLARMYLYGVFVEPDMKKYQYYKKAIEKSKPEDAQFLTAYQQFYGVFGQENRLAAITSLKTLIESKKHMPSAVFYAREALANILFFDEKILIKAIVLILGETEQGAIIAYILSEFYNKRIKNFFDPIKAKLYFTKAVEMGFKPALVKKAMRKNNNDYQAYAKLAQSKDESKFDFQLLQSNDQVDIQALNRPYWSGLKPARAYPWERLSSAQLAELKQFAQANFHKIFVPDAKNAIKIIENAVHVSRHGDIDMLTLLCENYEKSLKLKIATTIKNKLDEALLTSLAIIEEMLCDLAIVDELPILANLVHRLLRIIINAKLTQCAVNEHIAQCAYRIICGLTMGPNNKQIQVTKAQAEIFEIAKQSDKEKAKEFLLKLANEGDSDAIYALAIWYKQKGKSAEALVLFFLLMNQGYPEAKEFFNKALSEYKGKDKYYRLAHAALYAGQDAQGKQQFSEYFNQIAVENGRELFLKYVAMRKEMIPMVEEQEDIKLLLQAARKGYKPAQLALAGRYIMNGKFDKIVHDEIMEYLEKHRQKSAMAKYLIVDAFRQKTLYPNVSDEEMENMWALLKQSAKEGCFFARQTKYNEYIDNLIDENSTIIDYCEKIVAAKKEFESINKLKLLMQGYECLDLILVEVDHYALLKQAKSEDSLDKEGFIDIAASSQDVDVAQAEAKSLGSSLSKPLSDDDKVKMAKEKFIEQHRLYKHFCVKITEKIQAIKKHHDEISKLSMQFKAVLEESPNDVKTEIEKITQLHNKVIGFAPRKFASPDVSATSEEIAALVESISQECKRITIFLKEINHSMTLLATEQTFNVWRKKIERYEHNKENNQTKEMGNIQPVILNNNESATFSRTLKNDSNIQQTEQTPDTRHAFMISVQLPAKEACDPIKSTLEQGVIYDPLPHWRKIITAVEQINRINREINNSKRKTKMHDCSKVNGNNTALNIDKEIEQIKEILQLAPMQEKLAAFPAHEIITQFHSEQQQEGDVETILALAKEMKDFIDKVKPQELQQKPLSFAKSPHSTFGADKKGKARVKHEKQKKVKRHAKP